MVRQGERAGAPGGGQAGVGALQTALKNSLVKFQASESAFCQKRFSGFCLGRGVDFRAGQGVSHASHFPLE